MHISNDRIYGNMAGRRGIRTNLYVLDVVFISFLCCYMDPPLLARVCAWDCCAGLLRFCGVEKTRVNEKL